MPRTQLSHKSMGNFLLPADSLHLLEVGTVPICLGSTEVQSEQCRAEMSVTLPASVRTLLFLYDVGQLDSNIWQGVSGKVRWIFNERV